MDIETATRIFIRETVIPVENEHRGDFTAAGGDDLRRTLQQAAREAGVYGPHVPTEYGGLGLGMVDRAPIFEEAGYSLFGPTALHIAAPDEGNVHLLNEVAKGDQREQFLAPLARGEVRSAFAMTEPAPGAGSDPSALTTQAVRSGAGWVINGRKWFITGADGAAYFIVMARTSGEPGDRGGATMFLVPATAPGLDVGRHLPTLDRSMIGGHCEVTLTDVEVGDDAILGEVDEGFRYAQVRLGPARMTHIMRWLGAARRAHDEAVEYVAGRESFGAAIGDQGLAQRMIADNEIDIAATRALMRQACVALDAGASATSETSMAKVFGSEAIGRIVDNAVQLLGGQGVCEDFAAARIYREVRPLRIYDGASEVHRLTIAKRTLRRARGRLTERGLTERGLAERGLAERGDR